MLALREPFSVLFMLLVLLSAMWSIHPDLTVRRGAGYVLTMLIVGYLSVRFDVDDRMRVLSAGFAIAALGSLLFVGAFPQYGIMGGADLAGDWRGVFPHKNVLGPVMSVAVFTELYLLVRGKGRPLSRLGLLCAYYALVLLSHSSTALLLATIYLIGACVFVLWARERLAGVLASITVVFLVTAVLTLLWDGPEHLLGLIGKDVTLTGRTTIWGVVFEFIRERPVLGWGYRAMWEPGDATTALADKLTGGWSVPSSHNAFLEVTLQLGLLGIGLMAAIIGIALWRGLRCCGANILPLGWFSLMFFLGTLLGAQTLDTLGRNQVIDWVAFNVLSISCGGALQASWKLRRARARNAALPLTG